MQYEVMQVCNNNVVLARKPSGDEVVIMGKGVGFGVHRGASIDESSTANKVFSVLDSSVDIGKFKHLDYDTEKIEQVTRDIVSAAQTHLGIQNDKLYDALYDHIVFAIERLRIGLSIENPFISEISVMCMREFEVAEIAAKLIREQLDVDIGEPEKGFIALHLYSAQGDKHISAAMKDARFYQQALDVVIRIYDLPLDKSSSACRSFLATLNQLVAAMGQGVLLVFPAKQQVRVAMTDHYRAAQELGALMAQEMKVVLTEDALAYLAVSISLLVQV